MKKTFLTFAAFIAFSPFLASTAQAQFFGKADDAIEYRQGAFQLMKAHFSALEPMVKRQVPFDQAAVVGELSVLNIVSTLPWQAFGPGTEGGDASDDIWLDPEGFKSAQDKFLASLQPLTAAANEGNLDKLRAAFVDTGASCKACHDSYRE
mgnify:FL=1